ncbi:MAG: hypothetical protein JWQ71_759 [Pedosphaera sp.]|nr:hypothetical protein [Pedosphaera sp.]
MKKLRTKTAIALISLFSLLFLFVCIEHFRGSWALRSRLKELTTKGEKLSISELIPPSVPLEQNAAQDLFALTNEFKAFDKIADSAPPRMRISSPGHAVVSRQWDFWPLTKTESNTWAKFTVTLAPTKASLHGLQSVWSKTGFDDGYDYSKGFVDFQSPRLLVFPKKTAMLLSAAIIDDLHRNDSVAATEHLHSLLALVKVLENQKLVISQLVRIACARLAFSATWEALQYPDWNDAQLAEVQAAWQANEFPEVLLRSMEMERNMNLDYFNQIRASRTTMNRVIEEVEHSGDFFGVEFNRMPTHGFVLHYAHLPLWRIAWAGQDELRALNRWQAIIDGGRVANTLSWSAARDRFPTNLVNNFESLIPGFGSAHSLGWYDRCRFLFSEEAFSITGFVISKALQEETEKNMVLTAISLKRYKLGHGQPAPELAALVPEFLLSVPLDRMDGKPLRYHLNPDGTFLLYSVGMNGKDDGGDPQLENPAKSAREIRDIWKGKDVVWPALSSENEVAEAFRQAAKDQ